MGPMPPPRSSPFRVCLVCMGNICRSPMAEAVLRARLADAGLAGRVEVSSAGTGDWHVGDDADPRARAVLTEAGYALEHRARQFRPEWFARYDLVVALDAANLDDLRRLAPDPETAAAVRLLRAYDPAAEGLPESGLGVPDPYYGGADGFPHVLALVEAACEGLVAHLAREVAVR
jgi:protein-tyrosine phosphatase